LLDTRWRRKVPVVLQAEASECALACVAMVAAHHGRRHSLHQLRKQMPSSGRGSSLTGLIRMAARLGLESRPIRMELHELKRLPLPCILHWELNHFVVLERARGSRIGIIDPASGRRRLTLDRVSSSFTGVALELLPGPAFRKHANTQRLRAWDMLAGVRGLGTSLARILCLAISLEALAMLAPLLTQIVTDQVLAFGDLDLLVLLGLGFMFLLVVQIAIGAVRAWAVNVMGANLRLAWSANLFGHLLRLPEPYFRNRSLGEVVSRFGSMSTIQECLTTRMVDAVLDGLVACVAVIVVATYSVVLACVPFLALLVGAALQLCMLARMRDAHHEGIVSSAQEEAFLLESLRGVRAIKLLGAVEMFTGRYANKVADATNRAFDVGRLALTVSTVNDLLSGVFRISMLWLGARLIVAEQLSIGMMMAAIAYGMQAAGRGSSFIGYLIELRMLGLHLDRLSDIVLVEPETGAAASGGFVPTRWNLELRGVCFRYGDDSELVLDRVDLAIPEGKSVAIMGDSGSGKTTLAKIIVGLLDPEAGKVLLGGHEVKGAGKDVLREAVGTVMQDDQIFAGTVAENIAFFDREADQAAVEAAAIKAQIHDDIMSMPMGYESLVGGTWGSISGGQKQRLLIARALYRKPRILVLDEATCHLDLANEAAINASLCADSITTIVIAHRPETAAFADRVLVMDRGVLLDVAKPGGDQRSIPVGNVRADGTLST